jgi:hypothetical protein
LERAERHITVNIEFYLDVRFADIVVSDIAEIIVVKSAYFFIRNGIGIGIGIGIAGIANDRCVKILKMV